MMRNMFRRFGNSSETVKRLQNMTSQLSGINATCQDLYRVRSNFSLEEKNAEKEFLKEAYRFQRIINQPSQYAQPSYNSVSSPPSSNFIPGMVTGYAIGTMMNSHSGEEHKIAENKEHYHKIAKEKEEKEEEEQHVVEEATGDSLSEQGASYDVGDSGDSGGGDSGGGGDGGSD